MHSGPRKVPDRKCKLSAYLVPRLVQNRECSKCYRYTDVEYTTEYGKKCDQHHTPKCEVIYKEHCDYTEKHQCRTHYKEVCKEGYGNERSGKEHCEKIPLKECETIQVPNCREVPEEVCSGEHTEESCHEVPIQKPRRVSKQKCVWPEILNRDDERC
ncbi:uncharacterized protein LOC111712350 [Eurytemora carolleeae]|uniref:uncharacterized protein LOC111712350 n=1 Tax=Eurytemora carolleeae TaxID=1294199 RepID=UPI000C78E604|nr:uncharacterized protein LOC111712350 [Eurytemora carolleeae]|eukprot:XP_023342699.1 uncharacterized protein LOC111712350 [Eurytemora affinis]